MQNRDMLNDIPPLQKSTAQPIRSSLSPLGAQPDGDELTSLPFVSKGTPLCRAPMENMSDINSAVRLTDTSASSLHQHVVTFMQNPMLAVRNQPPCDISSDSFAKKDETNLLRDVSQLRELVATAEAEVRTLHDDIARLEKAARRERCESLLLLRNELPADVDAAIPTASGSDAEVEEQHAAVMEALLREVRMLEESTTIGRLENSEMEDSLCVLYAEILAKEREQRELDEARKAEDAICDALRMKVQEAHHRLWDHRQHAEFLYAAESKYLEQIEMIQRLRDELQACGLPLPIVDHPRFTTMACPTTVTLSTIHNKDNMDGMSSGGKSECISTINRHMWEQRCARRVRKTKQLMPPHISKLADITFKEMGDKCEMDSDEQTDTIRCVLCFPHGVLLALYNASLGPAPMGNDSRQSLDKSSPAPSSLRRRAQQLGISLQYLQHTETSLCLPRTISSEGRSSSSSSSSGPGVRVQLEGPRCLVEQFMQEIGAAVERLGAGSEVQAEVGKAAREEVSAGNKEATWREGMGRSLPPPPSSLFSSVRNGEKEQWSPSACAFHGLEDRNCSREEEKWLKSPPVWSDSFLQQISARVSQASGVASAGRKECDGRLLEEIRAGIRSIVSL